MDGRSKGLHARLVCHCLLVETASAGLVLVDTGYGLKDVQQPFPRLSRPFASLLNIRFREEETAIRQVEALGFAARDVRHIVITHLDFDHAGGLEDFPEATIHLMAAELDAARMQRRGFVAKNRYRPMQFDEVHNWRVYQAAGDDWMGFGAVRVLDGIAEDIALIPLIGHTWGHAGVAVRGPGGWLLHAGDAYFHRDEVRRPERKCPLGLRLYQNMMEVDRDARLDNQRRLRELALDTKAGVRMICAHDAIELEECLSLGAEDTQAPGWIAAPPSSHGARPTAP